MKEFINYFNDIIYLLGENRKKLPLMVVLILASSMLDVAGIGLIAPYVSLIIDHEQFMQGSIYSWIVAQGFVFSAEELLVIIGFLLVGIFIFKAISAILINRFILRFCFMQEVELRSFLMHAYQTLPYTEYVQRNSSEYIHVLQTLITQYAQGVLRSFMTIISEGLVIFVILCVLAWANGPALGLLVLLMGCIVLIYDRFFRHKVHRYGEMVNKHHTQMLQNISEGIEGLKEIRILGKENHFHQQVMNEAKGLSEVRIKSSLITLAPRYILELTLVAFVVLLVVGAIVFEQDLAYLIPTLSMFGIASLRLMPSTNQLISSVTQIRFGLHGLHILSTDMQKLNKDFSHSFERDSKSLKDKQNDFTKLQLNNICFAYPNAETNALNNISLEIHAGESIGIIGASGSGKSTMLDLFLGLLKPKSGEILYNDTDLDNKIDIWRSQIAYLPQQIFLIDNTIKKNIALGVEDIDENLLYEAIEKSSLSKLVESLPEGISTRLGERGVRLSGGQRQRIALARALYHGRNVLVMDEATSALDNETEKEIVQEIKKFKGKKTMLVIAHRYTTLEHCDRIYRLENGEIIEECKYEDLVK